MASKNEKSYSAPALEKGLDIVELLSGEEAGLTQSEIARALGRSVGEIFRMLMVLEKRGYVAQDPLSDRYALTTYLFELANRIPKIGRLTRVAEPMMNNLTKVINQSVHLAVLTDNILLVVVQCNSPGNNVLSVRLGAKIDPWQASSGRVILAFADRVDLEKLMKTAPLPDNVSFVQIARELDGIRDAGIEVRDSFVVKGVTNISAPVFDHSGAVAAALTVPHIERYGDFVSFETCKQELIAAAAAISSSLGAASTS